MDYENDKQVIFLKDLFFAILYRWKGILIAAVIGALLLGGFQFLQNQKAADTNDQEISFNEQQLLQSIAAKESAIKNQTTYLMESPIMNMDPYSVYKANLSFYIHNNYQIQPGMMYQNPDNTPALLNAYQQLLSDVSLSKTVSEAMDINALYVRELFTADVSQGGIPGVLTVVITFNDQAKLEQLTDLIKTYLMNATASLKEQLGEHTVRCTVTHSGLTTDLSLSNLQKQAADQLNTLNADLENLRTQRNALLSADSPRSIVLMAIIGGLVGAFLIAAIAVCDHLFSGSVYSRRTLTNRTDLRVLGCVAESQKKCIIDKWLQKWEGRASEEQIPLVCATIRNYLNSGESLMITCDPSGENTTAVAIHDKLSQAGIPCVLHGSLLRDAAAIEALPQADAVLILAQYKKSKYTEVSQIASQIQDQNKHLLGCVLING